MFAIINTENNTMPWPCQFQFLLSVEEVIAILRISLFPLYKSQCLHGCAGSWGSDPHQRSEKIKCSDISILYREVGQGELGFVACSSKVKVQEVKKW